MANWQDLRRVLAAKGYRKRKHGRMSLSSSACDKSHFGVGVGTAMLYGERTRRQIELRVSRKMNDAAVRRNATV